jgi:nucleotide-binding universal stress UspA family protein
MRVLYATDGGAPAEQALALLERAATPDKAQVTVVGVVGAEVDERVENDRPGPGADAVASAGKHLKKAGFEVDERWLRGEPGPAILEQIDAGGFEVAVVGAGNRSRLQRLLLGSVSTKVLHASPASVLIVHRFSDDASPLRVLFATDGSEDANWALEQMKGFLNPSSCQITVLTVAEHLMPHLTFPIPRVAYATSAPTPEQEDEWIAAAQATATAAAHKLGGAGFPTETRAVLGAPASRVLAEAQEMQADLVVVGSRGLGAVERAAMGSVSDQIVREAPATLVVRSAGRVAVP